MCLLMCVVCIYIYIYREREGPAAGGRGTGRQRRGSCRSGCRRAPIKKRLVAMIAMYSCYN